MPTKYIKLKKRDESMNISTPPFINARLCAYYKMFWTKCKKVVG